MLPDPVSCFEGSSYTQKQDYRLARGASLIVFDAVSSGRYGSGERWLFDSFASRIHVRRESRLVFFESLSLSGREGSLAQRNGRFNAQGLLYLTGPAFEGPARELVTALAAQPLKKRATLAISAAVLSLAPAHEVGGSQGAGRQGVVVRLDSESTEELMMAARGALGFLPALLGDDPWIRKW